MARFRLGLAGALILAVTLAWFHQVSPRFAAMAASAVEGLRLDGDGVPSEAVAIAPASPAGEQSDDEFAPDPRRLAARGRDPSSWPIAPARPDAVPCRPRARSTGPPAIMTA